MSIIIAEAEITQENVSGVVLPFAVVIIVLFILFYCAILLVPIPFYCVIPIECVYTLLHQTFSREFRLHALCHLPSGFSSICKLSNITASDRSYM